MMSEGAAEEGGNCRFHRIRREEVEGNEPVRSVEGDELGEGDKERDWTLEREGATLRSQEVVADGEGGRVR